PAPMNTSASLDWARMPEEPLPSVEVWSTRTVTSPTSELATMAGERLPSVATLWPATNTSLPGSSAITPGDRLPVVWTLLNSVTDVPFATLTMPALPEPEVVTSPATT